MHTSQKRLSIKNDQNVRREKIFRVLENSSTIIRMEVLQMESFLGGNKTPPSNNICERCLRKKFKCLIIFMLTIITLTQLFMTIFDKIDEKYVNNFFEQIGSKNSTFWTSLVSLRNRSGVEEELKGK